MGEVVQIATIIKWDDKAIGVAKAVDNEVAARDEDDGQSEEYVVVREETGVLLESEESDCVGGVGV